MQRTTERPTSGGDRCCINVTVPTEGMDRERVIVASLMQQGIELAVRKMMHHCGLRKEWVSKGVNVASVIQHNTERPTFWGGEMLHHGHGAYGRNGIGIDCCIVDATGYRTSCKSQERWCISVAYGRNGLAKKECCITVTVVYERNGIGSGWLLHRWCNRVSN